MTIFSKIYLLLFILFFLTDADLVIAQGFDELSDIDSVSVSSTQEIIPDTEEPSDWLLFTGRFHPVFVHLPIGCFLLAFFFEFTGMIRRYSGLQQAVPFTLLFGCLSGMMAALTGYLLSTGGGYGEGTLLLHKWMGIAVVVVSGVAFLLRVLWYEVKIYRNTFRLLLIIMVVMVMSTGHYGGSLTHGSDYLFRYLPEPFKSWLGYEFTEEQEQQIELIEDLDNALVYKDVIEPIIKTRCENCHNPDRSEAELLLTSYDKLMAGGESGPPIVLHNPEESELYKRLTLSEADDKRMPPRGRRQLTGDQIKLIKWWIEQGAPPEEKVPDVHKQGEIADILQSLTVDGQDFFDRIVVPEAEDRLIKLAEETGFQIAVVAEDLNFLDVKVSKSLRSISLEDMEVLRSLSEQIIWLDLSRLDVHDHDLQNLSEFTHLRRLSLQETAITDSTLVSISGLEYLEYLNVYGTQVTDRGLTYLEAMISLKALYLWQTNVSSDGIERLQASKPILYINTGWEN